MTVQEAPDQPMVHATPACSCTAFSPRLALLALTAAAIAAAVLWDTAVSTAPTHGRAGTATTTSAEDVAGFEIEWDVGDGSGSGFPDGLRLPALRVLEDPADCFSTAVVPVAVFQGIVRCAAARPLPHLVPPVSVALARATLFGHCGDAGKGMLRCSTYFHRFEYLKLTRPTTRMKKPSRKSAAAAVEVAATEVHEAMHVDAAANLANAEAYFDASSAKSPPTAVGFAASPYTWWHAIAPRAEPRAAGHHGFELPRYAIGQYIETASYDVAIMLPWLTTCLDNLYHGTFEFVLPIFQALQAVRALHPNAKRIALLVRPQPLASWGGPTNTRCTVLNAAPYGLGGASRTAFMFQAMRQAFRRLDVVAYNEGWRRTDPQHRQQQLVNATFTADVMYRGLPSSCFGFPSSVEQGLTHSIEEYPFVRRSVHCSVVLRQFRASILEAWSVPDPGRITAKEARCPNITIVSRRRRRNGRDVHDPASFAAAVRAALRQAATRQSVVVSTWSSWRRWTRSNSCGSCSGRRSSSRRVERASCSACSSGRGRAWWPSHPCGRSCR
jgi:hypothetical protein